MASDTGSSPATLGALPVEVLALIAHALLPSSPPGTAWPPCPGPIRDGTRRPRGHAGTLRESRARLPSTAYTHDLVQLAAVSRRCAAAALPVLYAVLLLRTRRQVRVLARTLHASEHVGAWVRSAYLTAYDAAGDDGGGGAAVLRAVFDACPRIDHLGLSITASGGALGALCHPATRARPRILALHNHASTTPALRTLDCRPLGHVTHLHLVDVRIERALLDFLHGIPAGHTLEHAQGTHPLSHLRIALDAAGNSSLVGLDLYIEERERSVGHVDGEHGAPPPHRWRAALSDSFHPDHRHHRLPSQRHIWTQASLYNLAADADLLPHLRLVQLAIQPMRPVSPPAWDDDDDDDEDENRRRAEMEREAPVVSLDPPSPTGVTPLAAPAPISTGGLGAPFEQFAPGEAPGALATIDFPTDVPLNPAEAAEWARLQERQRTADRDAYWLAVRQGKEALVALFQKARAWGQLTTGGGEAGTQGTETRQAVPDVEVRVVLDPPGRWNHAETQAEFAATAFSSAIPGAGGGSVAATTTTCWDSEDVFALAARRPELSLDGRGRWTGELPRLDSSALVGS